MADELEHRGEPPAQAGLSGFVSGNTFLWYLLAGWLVQLIFSLSFIYQKGSDLQVVSRAIYTFCILWFVGSGGYFLGMMAGFLFGFPKAALDRSRTASPNPAAGAKTAEVRRTRDNTNLEDISDWLTKIIVGLGLVNFRSFLAYIDKFGTYIGNAITQDAVADTGAYIIAIASALYGFACGFLFFYI